MRIDSSIYLENRKVRIIEPSGSFCNPMTAHPARPGYRSWRARERSEGYCRLERNQHQSELV